MHPVKLDPLRWMVGAALLLVVHYAWEMLQAPWFREMAGLPMRAHSRPCLRAAFGDLAISSVAYGIVAALYRRPRWPFQRRWGIPALLWMAFGLAATVLIERLSLASGRWSYTEAMPTVAGVGVLPLAQWVLVPVAVLILLRLLLCQVPA